MSDNNQNLSFYSQKLPRPIVLVLISALRRTSNQYDQLGIAYVNGRTRLCTQRQQRYGYM